MISALAWAASVSVTHLLADHLTTPDISPDRGALSFDSRTDHVEVPNDGSFDVSDSLTIEAWININEYPNSASWVPLISIGSNWGLFVRKNSSGDEISFNTGTSTADELVYNAIPALEWHHVAAVFDGPEKRLFVDGHEIASTADSVSLAPSGEPLVFGEPAGNSKFYSGSLDAVRVWSKPRSEAEIQADIDRDLSASVPPSSARDLTGLLGEWRFDEVSGTLATDSSGNERDGTLLGSPVWIDGLDFLAPPPLSNVPRHALRFDGAGAAQSVIISEESDFEVTAALTIETWIHVSSFAQETQPIVTKGNAWGLYLESEVDSSIGTLVFKTDSNNDELAGTTKLLSNRWYHVAAVYDGTEKHLYVDGVSDATGAGGALGTNDAPVVIAGNADDAGLTLQATLDNVRIWQSARSQADLEAHRFDEIFEHEPDLLGEWRFNEISGNQAYDQSLGDDRRRHGTLINLGDLNRVAGLDLTVQAPLADQAGSAVDFSGGSPSLRLDFAPDHQGLLDQPDALTLETWIQIDALNPGETQAILTRGKAWGLAVKDDGALVFYSHDGATRHDLNSKTLVQPGRWYHLAAVFDGNQKAIYIDGLLDGTAGPADGSFSGELGTTGKDIRVGALDAETPITNMAPLEGRLDAVRIWWQERTVEEILATMDHQLRGAETGLFAAWRFDSSQTTLKDDSSRWGRHLDGTIAPADHADGLALLPPLSGNLALAFYQGGGYAYARVAHADALNLESALTVEAWVRIDEWPATGEAGLVSKGADAWGITVNAAGHLVFRTDGVTDSNAVSSETLSSSHILEPGTWVHVAVTWGPNSDPSTPGSSRVIYINGAPESSDAGLQSPLSTNAGFVVFGAQPTPHPVRDDFLIGALDEVRIWSFARTAEQIRANLGRHVNGNEPGLVGAWSFDDIQTPATVPNTSLAGSVLDAQLVSADPILNRADGRILGEPVNAQYALFFDGVFDQVTLPAKVKFDLAGSLTIEAWVRPVPRAQTVNTVNKDTEILTIPSHGLLNGDTVMFQTTEALPLPLETGAAYYVVNQATDEIQLSTSPGGLAVDLQSSGSGTQTLRQTSWSTILHSSAFGLALDANHFVRFYVNGLTQNALASNRAVVSDVWRHVAVVIDTEANTATFYIDGKPAGTSPAPTLPATTGALTIGSQGGTTNFFRGELDEVRIWQTARKDFEVNLFAFQEVPPGSAGLAGYYDFNDGSGTTLSDRSGYLDVVDGTLEGGTWSFGPDFGVVSLPEGLDLTPNGDAVGLWIGQVVIDRVNEVQTAIGGRSEQVTPTADTAALRMLLHVNAAGQARLIKDVVAMQTRPLGNEDPQLVLVTDPALIPDFDGIAERGGKRVGLRYGTVAYDFEGHDLPMAGGVGPGLTCTGTIDLAADMATNPYRHKFHPQHQNGYDVRRQITIEFARSPDAELLETITGTYHETVTGLHKIPIEAEGTVVLNRISEVSSLNGAE